MLRRVLLFTFRCASLENMKLTIEFNDQAKSGLGKKIFLKTIKKTLEASGLIFLQKKNVSLSVATVSEAEIQELNRIYRRKNSVTDILSFAEYKGQKELEADRRENIFLGELILCYNDIKKYAAKNGKKTQQELAAVVSHGTLHFLGFRHGQKMFSLQEKIGECIK